MRLWLSCRRRGSYMITRFPPVRVSLLGSDGVEDLYFRPGDPMAHLTDLCAESVKAIFQTTLEPLETVRINVTSERLGVPKLVEPE